MDEFEFHPIANLFPLMDDASLAELADDIKAHGLKEWIKLWQDKVIDGRNRYHAPASSPESSQPTRI